MTYLFLYTLSNISVHNFSINPSTQNYSIIIIVKTENNLLIIMRVIGLTIIFYPKKKNNKLTMALRINTQYLLIYSIGVPWTYLVNAC